ncbi:hypothetical protein MRX96_008604 [Rhipicephalus microplus]
MRPEESERWTHALPLSLEAVACPHFYRHKSYVIAGGLEVEYVRGTRGFALDAGANRGATVLVSSDDVSMEEGVLKIIQTASSMGPVGGIFNLAMVLRDALIENQTAEMYRDVCKPNVMGTKCLDKDSRRKCPSSTTLSSSHQYPVVMVKLVRQTMASPTPSWSICVNGGLPTVSRTGYPVGRHWRRWRCP